MNRKPPDLLAGVALVKRVTAPLDFDPGSLEEVELGSARFFDTPGDLLPISGVEFLEFVVSLSFSALESSFFDSCAICSAIWICLCQSSGKLDKFYLKLAIMLLNWVMYI